MSGSDHRCDVAVVGAGIVGLATALELTARHPGLSVIVLDKEPDVARHQTGHNSGVIHSGIYYKPGSHKARLCVEGARRLRRFCEEQGVPHDMVGKVVVATEPAEIPALRTLHERGLANGVEGLELIGPERLAEIEPHARAVEALWSPATGILDYGEVARAYARVLRDRGHRIVTDARVTAIRRIDGGLRLVTTAGEVSAGHLLNCAGLYSDRVARLAGLEPDVRIVPFRGEYHVLAPHRHDLVRGLIYPVPDPRFPFLGVHLTRMISGGVEAGPNAVLALAREGYSHARIHPGELLGTLGWPGFWHLARRYWRTGAAEFRRSFSKAAFARALQKLVPAITAADLAPGGAGVRAQAVDRDGALLDDFHIVESENAVHVLNAPSPAATASLAIGAHVAERAATVFGLPA